VGGVAAAGDGEVNIGVSFRNGGGVNSVVNQLFRVQGEFAGGCVFSGQVLAWSGSADQPGQTRAQVREQAAEQKSRSQTVSDQPGTFRFRFGGEGGGSSGFTWRTARSRGDPC